MDSGWKWRVGLVIGVTLLTIWFLIPSAYSLFVLDKSQRNNLVALQEKLPAWAPSAKYRINLGLDLQGGIHMVMRVDTKTALEKRTERRGDQIARYINTDAKLGEVTAETDPTVLQLTLTAKDPATMDAIEKDVLARFTDFSKVSRDGGKLVLSPDDAQINHFREESVDQAMLVIRRRIDKWGVSEVDVRKQGSDAIQISLPGRNNPEQAKELVGTTAQLEFRMVDDSAPFFATLFKDSPPGGSTITLTNAEGSPQLQSPNREALLAYVKDKTPKEREVLLECIASATKRGVCDNYRTFLVEKDVPLTGESLTGADASLSPLNEPEVNISFDPAGAREFEQLTEKGSGRRMAIVLDDNVQSAPHINEKISGGRARITMGRSGGRPLQEWLQDAQTLALALKAGALPAPVTTGEIRQVGASLGDELIRKGSLAALVGVLCVVAFMAVYYKSAGIIADVALLLNGLLILGGLALFNATLTLPGLAGFVLTLGIAVDANVLINERIREEISHGKSARAAVDQGYDRAFWTIFDAHVTALIAGFILFFTGTGPVRGFATTMIIGLLASLFTSILVTRVIMTYFVHGQNAQTVSV